MDALLKGFAVLPWLDWVALAWFFVTWLGYAVFAQRRTKTKPSVLASTNRVRRAWMFQATKRDVRVVDGLVVQNLSSSPSFFASTSILVIGALLALLGTGERASALATGLPFAKQTSVLVFDLKIVLLLGIFIFAFFRFTWSMRQYTFGALLIGSMPEPSEFNAETARSQRELLADQAGSVMGLAAESFNEGLRAYYMAFAAVGWFFSPLVLLFGSAAVVYVVYQREFNSQVLTALNAVSTE